MLYFPKPSAQKSPQLVGSLPFLRATTDFMVQLWICYFSTDVVKHVASVVKRVASVVKHNVQKEGFVWLMMVPEG